MHVNVTFRHMDATDAIRDYATEKLARLEKFIEWPLDAHVVVSMEKFQHVVEISVATRGNSFKGMERSEDMYASIDSAVDKVERQIVRYKEKVTERKGANPDKE